MSRWVALVVVGTLLYAFAALAPSGDVHAQSEGCAPVQPPAGSAGSSGGLYRGPLFDTHIHISPPSLARLGTADALCRLLDRMQTPWAIGFYYLGPSAQHPTVVRAAPIASAARNRVIPLIQPTTFNPPGSFAELGQGQYTEGFLKALLRPQGIYEGIGEVPLYRPGVDTMEFSGPQMQVIFRVVNELKLIVMIHPRGDVALGRALPLQNPAEVEAVVRANPNAIFLFHGGFQVFDQVIAPLMSRYPNVYYTMDLNLWGLRESSGRNLMAVAGDSPQRLLELIASTGEGRIAETMAQQVRPRLERFPDRLMWGTDFNELWHYSTESVSGVLFRIGRQAIARLPDALQEPFAYRNAMRVFGPFLGPSK